MKTPIPSSVLSCARCTVAAYDISAFLPIPHDVGGRALSTSTRSQLRRRLILPVIIVATLAFAIAILAVAAANADTIPKTNGAVVVRYSDKIAFGAAQSPHNDNIAVESVIERRMRSLNPQMYLRPLAAKPFGQFHDYGRWQQSVRARFLAPVLSVTSPSGAREEIHEP